MSWPTRSLILPSPIKRDLAFLLVLLLLLAQPAARGADSLADDVEFFEASVRPLLVEKCWSCHGPSGKIKGGLRLVSRASILKGGDSGPAAVAGDPSASLLVQATRYDHDPKMPPAGKLPDRQIDALARWVAMGLPWPETKPAPNSPAAGVVPHRPEPSRRFWSFEPVHDVPAPAGPDSELARSPIDRFLLHELQKQALSFAGPADKRTLIRRATFDLTGLPPTPEEIDAFLVDDSPDAFARVVDRLLASPRYGERWGRHWLDVVRYADARDLIQLPAESDFRESWRYRDWVVAAFNRDMPYPDFIRYQLAGDLLPPPRAGRDQQGRHWSPRACSPSPTSCPATWTRTR